MAVLTRGVKALLEGFENDCQMPVGYPNLNALAGSDTTVARLKGTVARAGFKVVASARYLGVDIAVARRGKSDKSASL